MNEHHDHHRHDHAHDHAHDHSHGHSHHHGHNHSHGAHVHVHAPASFGTAFAIGIGLNTVFVAIEAGYGFIANSTALLADAGHNLSDVLGLVVAWLAATLAIRPPTARLTYGLRNSSILAALFNAVLLLLACGAIVLEAFQRLLAPQAVATTIMMAVAAIGIVINGATALLFARGRNEDLNIRGAYLHMAADAAISAGVVVTALLIKLTSWSWLDPAASLLIVAVIVWGTWGLLRESMAMSMAAVPSSIDPKSVRDFLTSRPGVESLHDLHIWPLSTTEIALTTHLIMPAGHPGDDFLKTTCLELKDRFQIGHATFQIETAHEGCELAPDHVV
jgi:cobalt-zinc-cadmium efflux system protein